MSERLENLRNKLLLNWGELAERLEISRAMLDFIRSGARNPSPKILRKIEQAEIEAGIRTSAHVREHQVIYEADGIKQQMLNELGGIKKDLDGISRRVDNFIKKLK